MITPSIALRLLIVLSCTVAFCLDAPAWAQITPDDTLGDEGSIVTPDVEVQGALADLIEGGAMRGGNLFHSFEAFNIDAGQRVYFANPANIESILSRVTGGDPSNIFGTLGVDGTADLFLINPNGIVFGETASLDIEGSFYATTAEAIELGNGVFSAVEPQNSNLLSVAPGVLFFEYLTTNSGDIVNNGDLSVRERETLTLIGNTISIGGSLTVPGGTVRAFGNRVELVDRARINVSSVIGGGTVLVGSDFQGQNTVFTAEHVFIGPNVVITADALSSSNGGHGGRVIVGANETRFEGRIAAWGRSPGSGGNVQVFGTQSLIDTGEVDTGVVALIEPLIVPSRYVFGQLPDKTGKASLDINILISSSCIARSNDTEGSFVITGNGGLPQQPGNATIAAYPTGTIRNLPNAIATQALQEPDGVYQLADGRLVLSQECQS